MELSDNATKRDPTPTLNDANRNAEIMGNSSDDNNRTTTTTTDNSVIDNKLIKIECNRTSECGNSNESVSVKIDPINGKKYVYKNGKRCGELVPVLSQPTTQSPQQRVVNLKLNTNQFKIIKVKPSQLPPLIKTTTTLQMDKKMRAVYNFKRSQGVITDSCVKFDKYQQTNDSCFLNRTCDIGVQTTNELFLDDQIINTILNDREFLDIDQFTDTKTNINLIDPNKPKTQEELVKLNFFNDINRALTFDRSGNLPIHESVMQNNVKLVKKNCVILNARKESINIYNSQNYTPLHLAILFNVSNDVLLILLKYNADVSLTDTDGNTAVHLAVEYDRISLLKILLDYTIHKRFNLNTYNYDGFTPLILSCCNRSYEITKLLLDKGADPNVRDMKSGRTALFHAAEAYDVAIVQLLINHKADTKVRNFVGTSPHDAMFELDDVPLKIKCLILGKEQIRLQNKRKSEQHSKSNGGKYERTTSVTIKKAKMEVTSILQKVEPKFQAVLDRVQFKSKC